jgi:hypothetical protein
LKNLQKYEIGVHWNTVTKKKTAPVKPVMAIAAYIIHLWIFCTVTRSRKTPIEIFDKIIAKQ